VQNATPYPAIAKRVIITKDDPQVNLPGDTEYNYSGFASEFPAGGVALNAAIVPLTAKPQTVNWSVTADGNAVTVENGVVERDGTNTGLGVVTAEPTAGGPGGQFRFFLAEPAPAATVRIVRPAKVTYAKDETAQLTAIVGPLGAPQDVTWEVFAADGTSPTTDATISATGLLTVADPADLVKIQVVATAASTSITSLPLELTLVTATSGSVEIPFTWTFGVADNFEEITGITGYAATGDAGLKRTDSFYKNSMIITASNISDAAPSANGLRWVATQSTWTGGPAGVLQPNSATHLANGRTFIKIEKAKGPFIITLSYTSTGSGNNDRFAQLYVDGSKVADGAPTSNVADTEDADANTTDASRNRKKLVYEYRKAGVVDLTIGANNGIRLAMVEIEEYTGELDPDGPVKTLTWEFKTAPAGWVTDGTDNTTDADYGNGMTLTASTRACGFRPTQAGPGTYVGCIQPTGAGNWAKVTGLPGTFTVTAVFANTGNSEVTNRWFKASVGDSASPSGIGQACVANNATAPNTFTWTYTGTPGDLILTADGNALRIYQVKITYPDE
jgi:hypothetical protein